MLDDVRDTGLGRRFVGRTDTDPRLHGKHGRWMTSGHMQSQPVIKAMSLDVVHRRGCCQRECGSSVMIGTAKGAWHVSDDRPSTREFGYPQDMKRLLVLALLGACGGEPVDAEGTYSVGVTNREDGCKFGWTVNEQTPGIQVVITQNGSSAIAEVKGAAAIGLGIAFGSATFSGDVDGDELNLFVTGTNSTTRGNCTFTYDGRMEATLAGDSLQGSLLYVANTNTASDCAAVQCMSKQDFAGSRPPR